MIVRDLLIPVPFNDTVLLLWLHGGYNPGWYCSNRILILKFSNSYRRIG
jgi:hypothetical protein